MVEGLLEEKAERLRLLLLDVDGVFTDGGIVYAGDELEAKRFDVQDGMGITLAQDAGMEVGIITGRVSEAVRRRADELGLDEVYQGHDQKLDVLNEILSNRPFEPRQLAYMGDDVLDVPVLRKVGLAFGPANVHPRVREHCDFVADKRGGSGAIREVVDYLLDLRDQTEAVYEPYEGEPRGDS